MELFTRANQQHLGRVSMERPASVDLLLGVQPTDCNREKAPRGIHGEEAAQYWWLE